MRRFWGVVVAGLLAWPVWVQAVPLTVTWSSLVTCKRGAACTITGYVLYRSLDGGPYVKVGEVGAAATQFKDKGIPKTATTVCHKIAIVTSVREGALSEPMCQPAQQGVGVR